MADRIDPFEDAAWADISVDEPATYFGLPAGRTREPGALRWIPEPPILRRPPDSCMPPPFRLLSDDPEAAPGEKEPGDE
jgi:hypothetical protein